MTSVPPQQSIEQTPQPLAVDKSFAQNTTALELSPIQSEQRGDESFNASCNFRHDSSVLNISATPAELKYHVKNSGVTSDEWSTPQHQTIKEAKTICIGHKGKTYDQSLKFHVPSNYSLHPARSPVAILNLTFDQFDTIFTNIYEIFGSIYTFFAMELATPQKVELNRTILFPLESITEKKEDNHIITTCKQLNCKKCGLQYHKIKYYLILFGFIAAIFTSMIQIVINPSNERLLLNVCCMLWFLRYALILIQQRKCILSSYSEYIRNNNNNKQSINSPSIKFNWLEIHLEKITSNRATSTIFNQQFLSYAFIFCCFFVVLACPILCYLILANALNIISIPIIFEVFLFESHNIFYALWIWFEFILTICFMIFLLPSFILSCVIVTNRFNNWKNVLDNSNELQFSQIRSYIFHGRHLLRQMNEQWSFYLTITIFTTVPHILLQLYTLVLTERKTSAGNQLFGWCWFIVVFTELFVTIYYGANIHKSFETLSKSVVDLGSRTMIHGDEQFINNNNNQSTNQIYNSRSNKLYMNTPKSSTINDNQARVIMMERCDTEISETSDYCITEQEEKTNDTTDEKKLRINTKFNSIQHPFFLNGTNSNSSNRSGGNPPLKGVNVMNASNNNNNKDTSPQLSINLLLLLISSMNSIDGIVVGGIFTLNFGVIAKFLSALFTFGILFIELTRGET